jgi:biopolymer transport protein ExbB
MFLQVNVSGEETETLLSLIMKGGWIMIPLFILSIIAVYIMIERYLTLRAAYTKDNSFLNEIKDKVKQGDINSAMEIAESVNTPLGRMIEKGLSRIGAPLKTIETSIENTGKVEIDRLEKNLSTLATIAGAGPMIGFLGTVMGMIQVFMGIKSIGFADVGEMSGGIYEAMVTTAAGLIVGLIAYISYNWLTARVQKTVQQMEHSAIDFVELLQDPQGK